MANYIGFRDESISCSNGLTSVLLTTIGLSGSRLAVTEDEKNLIVWLMTLDQGKRGIGTVGFDLEELPWKCDKFEQQKAFMLKVLEGVKNKLGWETLDYPPNEEMLAGRIYWLRNMIEQMTLDDFDENSTIEWLSDDEDGGMVPEGYPKCQCHGILLSIFGCMVCNDM